MTLSCFLSWYLKGSCIYYKKVRNKYPSVVWIREKSERIKVQILSPTTTSTTVLWHLYKRLNQTRISQKPRQTANIYQHSGRWSRRWDSWFHPFWMPVFYALHAGTDSRHAKPSKASRSSSSLICLRCGYLSQAPWWVGVYILHLLKLPPLSSSTRCTAWGFPPV